MKVEKLTGAKLDYWVMRALGGGGKGWYQENHGRGPWVRIGDQSIWSPSKNWSQSGPIMASEMESIAQGGADGLWQCDGVWKCQLKKDGWVCEGRTPMVAAMRTFVASKFGETVKE